MNPAPSDYRLGGYQREGLAGLLYRRIWHVSLLSVFISVYILFKAVFYLAKQALFGLDISYCSLSLLYGFLVPSLNK